MLNGKRTMPGGTGAGKEGDKELPLVERDLGNGRSKEGGKSLTVRIGRGEEKKGGRKICAGTLHSLSIKNQANVESDRHKAPLLQEDLGVGKGTHKKEKNSTVHEKEGETARQKS